MLECDTKIAGKRLEAITIEPCEGSVAHSDHATYDQKWCLNAGRYCKYAAQGCIRANSHRPIAFTYLQLDRQYVGMVKVGDRCLFKSQPNWDEKKALAAAEKYLDNIMAEQFG